MALRKDKVGVGLQDVVRPVIQKDPPYMCMLQKRMDSGPGMWKVDDRKAVLDSVYSTRYDELTNMAPRGVNPFSNDKATIK